MKKLIGILTCVLLLVGTSAIAATVDFGWDANTEADLAGYRIYKSTVSGQFVQGTDSQNFLGEIPAGTQTFTESNVTDGTYFWALTAFDTAGNESDFSNEVTLTIDETAPAAPSGFWGLIKKIISWLFGVFSARVS